MTGAVLVDTDVFSYLFRNDTRARRYEPELRGRRLCLSFMTVAELRRWTLQRRWGAHRVQSLEKVLREYVVLPADDAMCTEWARVTSARARAGLPIGCGDCWIAATALRHGLPLVTHNAADYGAIAGLHVINHA